MTEDERKSIMALADIIEGEINRMCVTKELAEFDTMYGYAKKNIDKLSILIYDARFLTESEEEKKVRCIDCRCKQQQFTGQAVPKFICTSSIWKELGRAPHVINHDMYKPIYCDHFEKKEGKHDGTNH